MGRRHIAGDSISIIDTLEGLGILVGVVHGGVTFAFQSKELKSVVVSANPDP